MPERSTGPMRPPAGKSRFGAHLAAGLSAALLASCAALPAPAPNADFPAILISGLEIRNELPYPITDVMIRVPATGAFAGCGSILPHSRCINRFENIDYRADAVSITWSERGQPHATGEFRIEPQEQVGPGAEYRVQVVVFAPGEAGARLVPATDNLNGIRREP